MEWALPFLTEEQDKSRREKRIIIVLNQPFSPDLFLRLRRSCKWMYCADGGSNRLFDLFDSNAGYLGAKRNDHLPDLIKGDLDSIRPEVRQYYEKSGVPIVEDKDQYATDLMKCIASVRDMESSLQSVTQFEIILLGGLSGRLDQTVHTMVMLHKLRKDRKILYVVTDDNVAWVLDEGEHLIHIDRTIVGPTCGLLPVGVESSILTTEGLQWNLTHFESSFAGLVSTSNAVVEDQVRIRTSKPIFWCIELKK